MNEVSPGAVHFSPSEAALEGFRLTRERPGTILAWGLINSLGVTAIGGFMLLTAGAPLIDYLKKGGLESPDPEQLAGVLAESWLALFGILVVVAIFLSIMTAGIYRLVLRPGEKGFIHLRLGRDELRLAAVNLVLLPLGLVSLAIIDAAGNLIGRESGRFAGLVAAVLVALPLIWVGVRLSLATPITFAEHRISIFRSWSYTKGYFWSLLGMIVLASIFWAMVWALLLIIYFALLRVGGGPDSLLSGASGAGAVALLVIALLTIVVQMVMPVLQWVMIYAPFAVAYQQIHGDPPANPLRAHPHHG